MNTEIEELKAEIALLEKDMKANYITMAQAMSEGDSQHDAYRKAKGKAKDGYAGASEWIKRNPNIEILANKYARLASLKSQANQIGTVDQKRRMLWDVAQRCMDQVAPKYAGSGENKELVGYVFDAKGAVSAISELNKMDGDHAAIKTENKHDHSFSMMSDEELDQRIAELLKDQGPDMARLILIGAGLDNELVTKILAER